jgi:hypothetical protein
MIPSVVLCAIVLFTTFGSSYDPLQYVDQFIGSSNGGLSVQWRREKKRLNFFAGNVFPGATLPYGLAKAVADTDSESNQGGFTRVGRTAKRTCCTSRRDPLEHLSCWTDLLGSHHFGLLS